MGEHSKHQMHEHSLEAYQEELDLGKLSKRCQMIVNALSDYDPRTDRQIMTHLGFRDMNAVRPRITELVKQGVLKEDGEVVDPTTNKWVRQVRLRQRYPEQRALF